MLLSILGQEQAPLLLPPKNLVEWESVSILNLITANWRPSDWRTLGQVSMVPTLVRKMTRRQVKFSDLEIVAAQPMGVRRGRAAELVGAPVLLDLMVQARWVEPTIQGNRLTVFDYGALRP